MQLEPLLVQEGTDPSQRWHRFFCALQKQDHARTILRKSQRQYAKNMPWYTATSPVPAIVELQAAKWMQPSCPEIRAYWFSPHLSSSNV